jgi:uncharacterized protein YkwD
MGARRTLRGVALAFASSIFACSSPAPPAARAAPTLVAPPPPMVGAPATPAVVATEGCVKDAPPAIVTPPKALLTIEEARRYMVALVNRDRRTQCLPPVELDDGAPTRAGQAHADDMATNGFLGHWGTDGSTPEQRHTEAGGADMVLENASCFVDEHKRVLDKHPVIRAEEVEKTEGMFWNEVPPNDGHRKNILKPQHRKVGIGIAQPVATPTEIPVPCFSQEFVDPYGTYAAIPKRARVGATLHVEGTIAAPATVGGVGLARTDLPKPLAVAEANRRRSYPVPQPFVNYWPPGFVTPIPVQVSGQSFAIDVPLSDGARRGLYEVSVWARLPGAKDPLMVGLRTIVVD